MPSESETPNLVEAAIPTSSTAIAGMRSGHSGLFSIADAAIAAGLLAATLAVCLPTAIRFRADARNAERRMVASRERIAEVRSEIHQVETRRAMASEQRRAVNRYLAEVDARPMTPWTTGVAELCRARPNGLWTVQMRGNGPRFQAIVQAARPDLVGTYAQRIAKSPRAEFAARPGAGSGLQVVGRWKGE
jgi:hypothetical protein